MLLIYVLFRYIDCTTTFRLGMTEMFKRNLFAHIEIFNLILSDYGQLLTSIPRSRTHGM